MENTGLAWTQNRVSHGLPLTIGYIGGLLTNGGGASNPETTSWRARTTAWFEDQFPGNKILEVNAAVGGTGSDLAAFRCATDLLEHDPDLVFVEFAVNDGALGKDRVQRGMEGLIRQIRKQGADVVLVYLTNQAQTLDFYEKGSEPWTVKIHSEIAEHYGIPEVHCGKALWNYIRQGHATWGEIAADGTHPGDTGYLVYFEEVKRFLTVQLVAAGSGFKAESLRGRPLPRPLHKSPLEIAWVEPADSFDFPDWMPNTHHIGGIPCTAIASDIIGAELSFEFEGTVIGIYWLVTPDGGRVRWSVDGGAYAIQDSWDEYALLFPLRRNYAILADSLKPGRHQLTVSVDSVHNNQSTGSWLRIVGFLVGR